MQLRSDVRLEREVRAKIEGECQVLLVRLEAAELSLTHWKAGEADRAAANASVELAAAKFAVLAAA
jgi:hypothetical protein